MSTARGSFDVTSWNEEAYEELNGGGKLTEAVVEQRFNGDIEGEGAVRWLMLYRSDGTAHVVGLQRVTGSMGGRAGSFVLETSGEYDGKAATGSWTVVAGSGTADLAGLRGSGHFLADPKPSFELDYEFG